MTEGQDASAAPAPWSGASRLPAAPDRGYAGAGQTGAGSVLPGSGLPGSGLPGSGLPGSGLTEAALADPHRPAGGYAAAPVPAAATSTPQQGPVSLKHGGTGWPGSEPGQSVTSPAGAGQSPSGQTAPADGESAVSAPTSASAGLEATQSGGIWAARAEPVRAARSPSVAGTSQGGQPVAHDDSDEPFARVDARKLEAALLGLRHPIVTVPLLFEAPGVAEARAERVKLLSQIDDYLLPRLRQSGAPILVALVGSTGAGKSTLVNSVVGKQVSATGIRRPTTNSPVLACHPDDVRWFAENVFLPTLPRVRQQGLAMPGRDGLLLLAASEGMPKGVALLDTPDIDSVVQAHHDFAHQFLAASDLWLFVTTARRYADAAVWEMLKDARDRGAALAIALSRVPPASARELGTHFEAMLDANGLREVRRFIIPETIVTEAQLPTAVAAPVQAYLADTARRDDRRVAVLTQTMSGVLDTFRDRVPALSDQAAAQLSAHRELRDLVDGSYGDSLTE